MALYLGCPMWGLKTWTGSFFPAGAKPRDFLALYSRRLNTVEGNTTFYAVPDSATVERWCAETPPGFQFCLKFPQAISHHRRLKNAQPETVAFLDRLERLTQAGRCGPAFLQLPPTFTGRHLETLADYLAGLPREFRYAVEPRHADFFGGPAEVAFDDLLRRHGAARVVFDTTALFRLPASHSPAVAEAQRRKPAFPVRAARTAGFAFVRFVGQPEVPANEAWLAAWAERAAGWLAAGDDVFFFLHNPDDTFGPEMARLFHALVAARQPVPLLPGWDPEAPGPRQAGLL
jgi:uncharacterized protein YecE (DUF72 family)